MMECNKWEKAYLLCDLCIVVTAIFTLEWYLFNKPSANILFLSIGDVFLSFIFPIIDLLLLLLGVTLIFRPAIFNAKSKLFIFILVLTGLAITDYLYFYLQGDLSERSVIFLRCLYRVFLLFIAILLQSQRILLLKEIILLLIRHLERNFLVYSLILQLQS